MRLRYLAPCATILCAIASPASAEIFCVGSSFNLRLALQLAASNGESDVIRLRPGTYGGAPGSGNTYQLEYDSTEQLTIEGVVPAGTGCSSTLGLPEDVVLDGGNQYGVLSFRTGDDGNGTFRLRNLRVTRGLGTAGRAACVRLRATGSTFFYMNHVIVDECSAPFTAMAISPALDAGVQSLAQILVQNNVLVRNISDIGSVIQLGGTNDATFTFSNNTVAYNRIAAELSSGSSSAAVGAQNPVTLFASNNVFHENSVHLDQQLRADLVTGAGTAVFLTANHLNFYTGTAALNSMGSVGDARLFGPTDPRPRADSPLIDSGLNDGFGVLPVTDADLAPRIQGGTIDRGAYEFEQMFNDGFE
jgi:hypothetical protein